MDTSEVTRSDTSLLELLQDITAAANEAENFREALSTSLKRVCDFMKWPVAHAFVVDNHGGEPARLISSEAWCLNDAHKYREFQELTRHIILPDKAHLPGKVFARGQPQLIPDIAASSLYRKDAALQAGLTSAFAFPIFSSSEMIAIIEFFSKAPIELDPQFLRMMERIADRLGHALERKQSEEQLRTAEAKYRSLIEQLPTIVYKAELDPSGLWFYVSPQIEKFLGFDAQYWISNPGIWSRQLHPEDRERVLEQEKKSYETGAPFRVEYRIFTRFGRLRWFRDEAVVERDASGRPACLSGVILDITEEKRSEEDLQKSEERYRSLVKQSSEGIFIFDPEKKLIQEANLKFAQLLGYKDEEIPSLSLYEVISVSPDLVDASVRKILRDGDLFVEEVPYRKKDGSLIEVEIHGSVISYRDARVVLVNVTDISERKRAEALQTALYRVAERMTMALDLQEFYAAIHEILGKLMYAKNFYIAIVDEGTGLLEYPYFVDEKETAKPPAQPLAHGMTEFVIRTGRPVLVSTSEYEEMVEKGLVDTVGPPPVDWLGIPLHTGDRIFGAVVAQTYDPAHRYGPAEKELLTFVSQHIAGVQERKKAEEVIRHQAYHDPLTELPNRMLFRDRFLQVLARARRKDEILVVLFVDIDRFKNINDTLGHRVGDQLLQVLAERLKLIVRDGDTIARMGGDEFMCLMSSVRTVDDAAKIAHKMLASIRPSVLIEGHELHVTASIGISVFPHDGTDPDVLIKNADVALYRAKEQGRDQYQLYNASMNVAAVEQLQMENRLRRALDRQEFVLYYQPILDLRTQQVQSTEALVRLKDPSGKIILPSHFIKLAEDTGLIVSLGDWVLRQACLQHQLWHAQGFRPTSVAVNLSARQFQQNDLLNMITDALSETGMPAQCLELELTESTIMKDTQACVETLGRLKRMGIRISIDDFGTGYSSLSYLKHLPIDTLKIDQSFMRDMVDSPGGQSIVAAIITMARSLDLRVVAEGVELPAQLNFLEAQDCDRAQGFFIGPPEPPAEAVHYLEKNRAV